MEGPVSLSLWDMFESEWALPQPPTAPLGTQLTRLLPQWALGSPPSTEQTEALGSHSSRRGPARLPSEAAFVVYTVGGPEVLHRGSNLYTGDTFTPSGGCSQVASVSPQVEELSSNPGPVPGP